MKSLFLTFALLLLATPAQAFELHVRDNDTGAMTEVGSIEPDRVIDFFLGTWVVTDQCEDPVTGELFQCEPEVRWGPSFEGQIHECRFLPIGVSLNPSRWEPAPAVSPNGALVGPGGAGTSSEPTDPLTVHYGNWRETGTVFNYFSRTIGTMASFSYGGCGDWGDNTWAILFDFPRTAFSIDLSLGATVGERYHLEFWDETGRLIGHQDIVNSADNSGSRHVFSWVSTVPIAGFSGWPQNGPGVGFVEIGLGESDLAPPPPKTLEERLADVELFLCEEFGFVC